MLEPERITCVKMPDTLQTVFLGIGCLLTIASFNGCSFDENAYGRARQLVFVRASGGDLNIQSVRIVPDGARPIVTGTVQAAFSSDEGPGKHLEISVLAPDGKLLARVNTNYVPRPIPILPRNPFHRATYAERLPFDPPPGSTIRVVVAWD